jgi:hypothetical protein
MKRLCSLALLAGLVLAGCSAVPTLKATTTPHPTMTATAQPPSNLLPNPTLTPYDSVWHYTTLPAGITISQTPGGGVTFTFDDAAASAFAELYITLPAGSITAGATYRLSYSAQGSGATNISTGMQVDYQDPVQRSLLGASLYTLPAEAVSSTLTHYATTFTAPAGSTLVYVDFFALAEGAPNSGSVSISQLQLLTLSV